MAYVDKYGEYITNGGEPFPQQYWNNLNEDAISNAYAKRLLEDKIAEQEYEQAIRRYYNGNTTHRDAYLKMLRNGTVGRLFDRSDVRMDYANRSTQFYKDIVRQMFNRYGIRY